MSNIPDSTIFTIFDWFQMAMRAHKRRIKWPKCKDVKKTYLFRALKSFAEKCYIDLELDDKTVRVLVYRIVEYAAYKKLLNKGAQMLCMDLIIDLCYQSIQDLAEEEMSLVSEIQSCHNYLSSQLDSKDNPVHSMIEPVSQGGYPKLIYWYQLGHLTPTYLALNKNCIKALSKISESDKDDLPSNRELFKMCMSTVCSDNVRDLKKIMGSDLRIPPTLKLIRS